MPSILGASDFFCILLLFLGYTSFAFSIIFFAKRKYFKNLIFKEMLFEQTSLSKEIQLQVQGNKAKISGKPILTIFAK